MKDRKEDYLFMIEQAMKAPSGHNTQPWLFHIHKDSIEIHPDYSKTLHIVDANRRELFVSLGCATENLCLAAIEKGYESHVTVSAQGIIIIQLSDDNKGVSLNTAYSQLIGRRQSNRKVYNGTQIPEVTMHKLLDFKRKNCIHIYSWSKKVPQFQRILTYIRQGNETQMSDPLFKKELKGWMRYNKKDVQRTNDGLSYAVFGAPNLPRWVSKLIMNACLTTGKQNRGDEKKVNSSSHLVLCTVENDVPEQWIQLGRALEYFLLKATEAGIAIAFINPPCELPLLSMKMQQEILHNKEIPVVLLRLGYASPMPYSPRNDSAGHSV